MVSPNFLGRSGAARESSCRERSRRALTRAHRSTLALCAMITGLVGCEIADVTVASPRAAVVVHAVLNPDADEQVILVESALTGRVDIDDTVKFDPLDPIRSAGGEPLSNATVRLLTDQDTAGVLAVETRVRGRGTGRYIIPRATLAVTPGRRYRLRIRTVNGDTVSGETRVPSANSAWVPGSGSTTAPVTISRSTDTLRLNWAPSPDARTYAIRIETPNGPWFLFSDSTTFSLAGTLRNFFSDGLPSVWYPGFVQPLSVVAVDRNFYDYNRSGNDPFGGSGLISSVQGGLGLFGSVVPILRRDVTVRDRDVAPIDARWSAVGFGTGAVEMDLWLETPGPTISSVSGRVRTEDNRYVVGTLRGDELRLITLAGITRRDTVSIFSGRIENDVLTGSYDLSFGTGPTTWRKQPRVVP
jgi:hypothetical protein